jgi:Na+-driven multidrug efflux pump
MLFIPLCGLMDCGALMLRGLGRSTLSMVISLIGACGLRIVWVYTAFAVVPEPWVLFLSYPLSWVLTGVAQFVCVWATTRKLKREEPSDEACAPA